MKAASDLYRVTGGKAVTQLRENFGFFAGGDDLFMWREELVYAASKGLIKPSIAEPEVGQKRRRIDKQDFDLDCSDSVEVTAFYAEQRG